MEPFSHPENAGYFALQARKLAETFEAPFSSLRWAQFMIAAAAASDLQVVCKFVGFGRRAFECTTFHADRRVTSV